MKRLSVMLAVCILAGCGTIPIDPVAGPSGPPGLPGPPGPVGPQGPAGESTDTSVLYWARIGGGNPPAAIVAGGPLPPPLIFKLGTGHYLIEFDVPSSQVNLVASLASGTITGDGVSSLGLTFASAAQLIALPRLTIEVATASGTVTSDGTFLAVTPADSSFTIIILGTLP